MLLNPHFTFADERPTVVVIPSVRRLLYLYAFRELAANRRASFWDKGATYGCMGCCAAWAHQSTI
jgi:hypothetical protein